MKEVENDSKSSSDNSSARRSSSSQSEQKCSVEVIDLDCDRKEVVLDQAKVQKSVPLINTDLRKSVPNH